MPYIQQKEKDTKHLILSPGSGQPSYMVSKVCQLGAAR